MNILFDRLKVLINSTCSCFVVQQDTDKMGDQIKVRFRVEYKGEEDDVDTPHPISVDMQRGSSIVDLLGNAAHFHSE